MSETINFDAGGMPISLALLRKVYVAINNGSSAVPKGTMLEITTNPKQKDNFYNNLGAETKAPSDWNEIVMEALKERVVWAVLDAMPLSEMELKSNKAEKAVRVFNVQP